MYWKNDFYDIKSAFYLSFISDMVEDPGALNETMRRFGAPKTCIRSYANWMVLLRPAQTTLGALVLIAREKASAFSQLGPASFAELHQVIEDVEAVLSRQFDYDKLNYLMLMMVDPDVHFHVLPRYASERQYAGQTFSDFGWPGPPDLGRENEMDEEVFRKLHGELQRSWPA